MRYLVTALLIVSAPRLLPAQQPLTVAERSNFQATSRHEDVLDFCKGLAQASPLVRLGELGTSGEGRKLPLVILAEPPVATPEEAQRSGKLVVFALGNIHAGEVDGKEALLMLARDIATAKERPLLKDLVIVFAPIFNADGNERIAKTNRRSQAGPADGVGVRTNAQGLDLNRDFVKLESPEVQALVRFLRQWDPAVFIDCHTTNGSYHRYTLTYEGGRCPAGDPKLATFVRDELLPDVSRHLEKATGFHSYFYGNFSRDKSRWETVPPTPRYGTHYVSLRNRISILSESYSYAPFKDRVTASRGFVQGILEYTAENKDKVRKLLSAARDPKDQEIVLRQKAAPVGRPQQLLGFVEEQRDGRRVATKEPKTYEVTYWGGSEPTLKTRRPFAYLFPAACSSVVRALQQHGVQVEELREDIELDVEAYRVEKIDHASEFQRHRPTSLQVASRKESRRFVTGTVLVRTAQSLGSLAAYQLEPQADDGLVTWNFFDPFLQEGKDFPVVRLVERIPVHAGRVRPLPEERTVGKPITFDVVYGSNAPNFAGNAVSGLTWLDDGEHFLQLKEARLYKVNARTGRSEFFFDPQKLSRNRGGFGGGGGGGRRGGFGGDAIQGMNAQRTAVVFEHEGDLYYSTLQNFKPIRLTKAAGREEIHSFSPNGQLVAFVRGHNLHVVDVATQTERQLTKDGSDRIFNGQADWVYGEEVFNRRAQAYWWSPDSKHIAFLRFDDQKVPVFTIVNGAGPRPAVENTPYPRAGEANPLVQLGIASLEPPGEIRWLDLSDYPATNTLVVHAGFTPDSRNVYCYAQDRTQRWLDVCLAPVEGGKPAKLLHEATAAWVDDPGPLRFLKDGSFLLASERTGWKHLYRYGPDGKLLQPLTSGPWEARTIHLVDENSGWVYFSGTRDSHIGLNLYRVRLDGTIVERLTQRPGEHRVSVSPKGTLFVDSWTDRDTPSQVRLCRTDGTLERTLDSNPVYLREEYRFGQQEYVQIRTPDGFDLEGILLKPVDFDPRRRYPVWFMTYGGPHAPTVRDGWGRNRAADEVKLNMGFLVFHCDPRSASGKGACSTWTAYKQLGVQELKDIETAIRWLGEKPYVDPARIGMSGHSYGGFMTAYAMTHSKLFAAGIAGAPVTDWRLYDSIYTERYMQTPKENPKGYDATSVVKAAPNLHGKLLLAHGMIDDNVHTENTLQLVDALQRADKDFEIMVYPRSRHGIIGRHYTRLQYDFMRRALRPGS